MNEISTPVPREIAGPSIAVVIERALRDPGLGIEVIERMIALRDRERAFQAECAFNEALAAAQEDMRPVARDMENPQTRSNYASLAQVDRAIREHYTRHRIVPTFDTMESPKGEIWVRIVCEVRHPAGFCRSYHIDMPADGVGAKGGQAMTRTHAMMSATTYGRRALLKLIFNLAEADDDGNAAPGPRRPQAKDNVMRKSGKPAQDERPEPPHDPQTGEIIQPLSFEELDRIARQKAAEGNETFRKWWRERSPSEQEQLAGIGGELRKLIDAKEAVHGKDREQNRAAGEPDRAVENS
jgi:ERF superfamily